MYENCQPRQLTRHLWQDLLPKLKYVLTDCDGVLWHADVALPRSSETFRELRARGLKVGFVTNNSTKSKTGLLQKFSAMNFDVEPDEVFCVNHLAVRYLRSKNVKGRVYMIGTEALQEELETAGFSCNPAGPDPTDGHYQSWMKMQMDKDVEAVVVGFDYHFSMAKVCHAATHLENPNCLFVATESDARVQNVRRTGEGLSLLFLSVYRPLQPFPLAAFTTSNCYDLHINSRYMNTAFCRFVIDRVYSN